MGGGKKRVLTQYFLTMLVNTRARHMLSVQTELVCGARWAALQDLLQFPFPPETISSQDRHPLVSSPYTHLFAPPHPARLPLLDESFWFHGFCVCTKAKGMRCVI